MASRANAKGGEIEVFDWLRPAVVWFLTCRTQWRRAGYSGVRTGIDYAGAEAAARLGGLTPTAEDFAYLQILEAETLKASA
jgi:hypothetical protein